MTTEQILEIANYPTDFVVIDFETYFTKDYSVVDMKPWPYITDDRFETIGCGFKFSGHSTDSYSWFTWADKLSEYFEVLQKHYGQQLENITIVMQNASFDALILQQIYNISPKYIIDLKHLSAHYDSRRSHSLKDMAKRNKLQAKGDTMSFLGLHLKDMTAEQRVAMESYCKLDCKLEYELFEILLPYLTNQEQELVIARHTIDLYLKPRLKFDFDLAEELKIDMTKYITEACENVGLSQTQLSGNLSFVIALQAVLPEGETVPTKAAKRPGKKMTALLGQAGVGPALAKTDDGCLMLLAHSKDEVRELMEARKAVKSWPLHLKRIESMKALATACSGKFPVPLNYYGAHCVPGDAEVLTPWGWERLDTWDESRIMQWMPDGSMRFLHAKRKWFYKCKDSMIKIDSPYIKGSFTTGHTMPRFGTGDKKFKPCPAADFMVRGTSYLPISGISDNNGFITARQMRVLVAVQADGHWQLKTKFGRELRFGLTKQRKQMRLRKLFAEANIKFRENIFPSHPGEITFRVKWADLPSWLDPDRKIFDNWLLDSTIAARLAFMEELVYWDGHKSGNLEYYSELDKNHEWVATIAHLTGMGAKRGRNGATIIRSTRDPQKAMVKLKHVSLQPSLDLVYCPTTVTGYWLMRQNGTISITGNTGRWSGGGGINPLNLGGAGRAGHGTNPLITKMRQMIRVNDSKLLIADAAQIEARILAWIAGQDDMVQAFAEDRDIYSEFGTKLFAARLRKARKTDPPPIAKLFTIRRGFAKDTVLGAGYGLGVNRFYNNCLGNPGLRPMFDSGQYDRKFVEKLINGYRNTYSKIPKFWKMCEKCFRLVTKYPHEVMRYAPEGSTVGPGDLLTFWNDRGTVNVQLPSGRVLYYPHAVIRKKKNDYDYDNQISYLHGPLWGGSLTENIVQAIARDLLVHWILKAEEFGLPVVLHIYDEIIAVSSNIYAEDNLKTLMNIMSNGPEWADGLPLAAEGEISETYKK